MGSKLRMLVLTLLACTVLAGSAAAQQGAIAGRVTTVDGATPLPGAQLQVLDTRGTVVDGGITGPNGTFRIPGFAPGTYSVTIRMAGYATKTQPDVAVAAGQTAIVNAALSAEAYALDPIVATAGRTPEKLSESPASISVVSQEAIIERPTLTPVDHMRSLPGIDIIQQGLQSTNVVGRGFNNVFSGALHTLTDNRIAGIPSLRVNLMHFIPATNEDIERMEVVLGPGSALYGPNTANGVLHILTKSPLNQQGTTMSVGGGERNVFQADFRTAQLLSENFGVKLSGQYVTGQEWEYTDPVESEARAKAVQADPSTRIGLRDYDIQKWSLEARADWRVTQDLTTVLSFGQTMVNSGIELTGIGAGQVQDWAYRYYQARANYKGWFAQAYLNTSDAGETFLLRTGEPIVDRSKLFVAQLQRASPLGSRQSFTYGVDFIRTMPETEGTINGVRESDDNYSELGAYLQSETQISSKLDLVLAGRMDNHSELSEPVFSPRAALVFKPREGHNFRATYNRAFSTPSSLNLFLDIDGGPAGALGPLGFRVRAYGPGRDGFSFRKSDGSLGMRSPFATGIGSSPPTMIDVTGVNLYDLQLTALVAASAAQGKPLPPQLISYMKSLREGAVSAAPITMLDPVSQAISPLAGAELEDVPGIRESISQTFEVGYKGILSDRLLVAADVWYEKKSNFTSPLLNQTPLLMLAPTNLAGYLVPRLTQFFMQAGMPQAQAQQQAMTIASTMAKIPGGVISSPDVALDGASLIATYRNFGELDLWGADLSAQALLTDRWSLGLTASLVSDDVFVVPLEGQPDQVVALNAPKEKGSATLSYRNSVSGFSSEVRARYTSGFPANSADYVGTACVDGGNDTPCVKDYTILDANVSYKLPRIDGASLQLSVTNLFDTPYQSFIGVPEIGRFGMLRLRYKF